MVDGRHAWLNLGDDSPSPDGTLPSFEIRIQRNGRDSLLPRMLMRCRRFESHWL